MLTSSKGECDSNNNCSRACLFSMYGTSLPLVWCICIIAGDFIIFFILDLYSNLEVSFSGLNSCFPGLHVVCNGWRGIISQKVSSVLAYTAQEEIFWELHWCSGLSWIAVLSGVFHNGTWTVAAWYIAPRGESALCTNLSVPSQRKVEWHSQASANMATHHIQNWL